MSILIDAGTEDLSRTTNLPAQSVWTMCGWYRHLSYVSFDTMFGINDGGSERIFQYQSSGVLGIWAGGSNSFATSPADGLWFFGAFTSATGDVLKGYWAQPPLNMGFVKLSLTGGGAPVPSQFVIGNDLSSEHANGRIANVKLWNATLTEDELRREMWSVIPWRTRDLNSWFPLRYSHKDLSGLGRNMTIGGTPTWTADEPPIPWDTSQEGVLMQRTGAIIRPMYICNYRM